MIVSKKFLDQVTPLIVFDYFQNSYIRKVVQWVVEFHQNYEDAPFYHIQDIFETRRTTLSGDEADLVAQLLTNISQKYETEGSINDAYLKDQAIEFFRKRELEIINGNVQILLEKGDLKGAEEEVTNFSRVAELEYDWINPFEEKYVDEVFEEEERLFSFPGQLGKFIGGIDREWLVGVIGAFKKGKTAFLQEFAVAGIQQGLRVAFISLEMTKKASNNRLYKRMCGYGPEDSDFVLLPCFDCIANQDGSCAKPERTNAYKLLVDDKKPEFSPKIRYKPCTFCRTDPDHKDDYMQATWKFLAKKPKYNRFNVTKKIGIINKTLSNYYRFMRFPKFSATVDDIIHGLDLLERVEDFVPDMIIIDYADVIRSTGKGNSNSPENIDDIWKRLAGMSGERRAIVVSASQTNRQGLDKKTLDQKDMSLWIGKLGHVDIMLSLNQMDDEKMDGVMRIGKMVHRHDEFSDNEYCVVLQQLKYGQVHLDSQIV